MATAEEVAATVQDLVRRAGDVDPALRARYAVDRTVSCRVSDLGVVWSGRLCRDGLCDVTDEDTPRAQVRVLVSSDDLLALAEGDLALKAAWASGRLRVQANPFDLLTLRTLL